MDRDACGIRRLPAWIPALAVLLVAWGLAACSATTSSSTTDHPSATTAPTLTSTAAPATTTAPPATTTAPPAASSSTTEAPAVSTMPASDGGTMMVPPQPPPTIDGVLGEGEWTLAAASLMSDGVSVHVAYHGETLYVAVDGDEIGAVNVVIATEEAVWILHSSAALGSALYQPGEGTWVLSHGFSWCCRDRTDDAGRLDLLDAENWQANIGYTGDVGTVEYEIALPWRAAALAISTIGADGETGFWPADLSLEASAQLLGPFPAEGVFNTQEWLVLNPAEE